MVLITNMEVGILNVVAASLLLISCITVTIYYYNRDKQDKETKMFNMNSIGLIMCVWATIILVLMGINLIYRG